MVRVTNQVIWGKALRAPKDTLLRNKSFDVYVDVLDTDAGTVIASSGPIPIGEAAKTIVAPSRQAPWLVARTMDSCRPLKLTSRGQVVYGRPCFLDDGDHYIMTNARETWLARLGEDTARSLLVHPVPNRTVLAPGNVLFRMGEEGSLFAQTIDVRTGQLTGVPALILQNVRSGNSYTAVSSARGAELIASVSRRGGVPSNQQKWIYQWTVATRTLDSILVRSAQCQPSLSRSGRLYTRSGTGLTLVDLVTRAPTNISLDVDSLPAVKSRAVWAPGDTAIAFSYITPSGVRGDWSCTVEAPSARSSRYVSSGHGQDDVMPDGKEFLFVRDAQTARTQGRDRIRVVVDWPLLGKTAR